MPYKDKAKNSELKRLRYQQTKELWRKRQIVSRNATKSYIWEIKKNSTCKCGVSHPAAIDFHHRDPKEKDIDVSQMVSDKWSKTRIDIELAKCDIMCSNCHRILHYELLRNEREPNNQFMCL